MLRFDATQRQKIAEVDGFKRDARKQAKAGRPKSEKASRGRVRDNGHLAFIRRLPCACGCLRTPCDAAHVRYADLSRGKASTGMAVKPDDSWTVPLHRTCHEAQHGMNERAWWQSKGRDPLDLAERLYAVSGDTEAGERIVAGARALP
jgi:hypothetical protein